MADAKKVTSLLLKKYPEATIALRFSNPLELLVATILSAQCTDARVNEVTNNLFRKYKKAADYAKTDLDTFQEEIRATGFYKNKAKTIISCAQKLAADFHGRVPATVAELTTLPGVGRKTANMVLANAFGQQTIAVDTHVLRVSNRLGLAHTQDADKVEQELMREIPHGKWTLFTNAMILHGRETCRARKPHCCDCVVYCQCEWQDKLDC
jgi:endonuclease-3